MLSNVKILVTGIAGYSHLVPFVLPAASALRAAGHDVTVAVPADGRDIVAGYGLDVLALDGIPTMAQIATDPALGEDDFSVRDYVPPAEPYPFTGFTAAAPRRSARAFIGVIGHRGAGALIERLSGDVPDLIVRDNTEFGGYLAAEVLGCPQLPLEVAPMFDASLPGVLDVLNEVRSLHGLPPAAAATEGPRIAQTPLDFYPPEQHVPGIHCFRPGPRTFAPLDPAIADLPADRPLVLVSLGSVAPSLGAATDLVDRIVEALGSLDVYAVVATGGHEVRTPPPNVVLTDFVDQQTVLNTCDAFITHGGFNGVREALQSGVPMVLLPLFGDHPLNSVQADRLGTGIVLDPWTVTAGELAAATEKVLADPSYGRNARRFARRSQALPELATFPERLPEILG
ncbi:Glycosyltransferase, MGT family OS=Tsukamurella paurometabola (strain ATCC 8368 / DSM / CCUG 35730 / CIP 100753 / JCM 10117 / KCTC 9821 / NBRC 16120 / NCIMB 702349 / NCTC 13040) OX=521096 GN=Tpau_0820 PE=3 SV=1 [Tsukamurella paurometabola]|uniref:Glycosyltransferase, MGT family n=1 Tax=Tsukamurella paurometabola (strain ATCC 8368 / DSM 20162 / CCUG 35730 / CIP 100753 / JCM 10117 / KCTC 9821 / NBRC 16120 / NCIMB 702349 / NCTC 13040) TaxID=521096 RepID=D5UTV2_TSUPD|nr:glycosyltransferase, MGT family [Tsukamurella paurometabola DSM 20162]SUP27120.1 PGL/p-HBAD biosynthesis glycosyltransferase Rv2958c/MT3034 [Tsukamurella paurometabola]